MFLIKKMFIKLVTNLLQTLHNSLIKLVNLPMRQLSGNDFNIKIPYKSSTYMLQTNYKEL
jgi:hypothetical protein